MFIVSVNHKVSLEIIEHNLATHVVYLQQQYALGNLLASGRQEPRMGGIILSNMENREALDLV